jgi:hypothetical protein
MGGGSHENSPALLEAFGANRRWMLRSNARLFAGGCRGESGSPPADGVGRFEVGQKVRCIAMKNDGRIEFLQKKLEADRAALAKEMIARARREKRETDKLDALLGGAVRKTGAASSDFRRMIAQVALCHLEEKTRLWLAGKGWTA